MLEFPFQLDIYVNNVIVEELTSIIHNMKAEERGRDICLRLKENLSREQFEYPIRAQINKRVVARETVKAYRKDVTAKVVSSISKFVASCYRACHGCLLIPEIGARHGEEKTAT